MKKEEKVAQSNRMACWYALSALVFMFIMIIGLYYQVETVEWFYGYHGEKVWLVLGLTMVAIAGHMIRLVISDR